MSRMPTISLCMIVRDEEAGLAAALEAARPLVDEMVVVDTGSTDRTPEIAAGCGARVVVDPWQSDFARARNRGLEEATGDWILVLDADEVLEPANRRALRRRLQRGSESAYTLEVVSDMGAGREERTRPVRLFRNRAEHRYEGRVHEQITPSLARASGLETVQPGCSRLRARHSGYRPDIWETRSKRSRNLRLLRAALQDDPRNLSALYHLARDLLEHPGGEPIRTPRNLEVIELAERAGQTASGGEAAVADLAVIRARVLIAFGRAREADPVLVAARRDGAPPLPLRFAEGHLALAAGGEGARLAATLFEACLGMQPEGRAGAGAVDPRMAGVWARERLGIACLTAGMPDEARRRFEEAAREDPNEAGPWIGLAAVARRAEGDMDAALRHVLEANRRAPGDPRAHLAAARLLSVAGESDAALDACGTALSLSPGWADALQEKAALLVLMERPAEADRLCEPYASVFPEAYVGRRVARALMGTDDDEALDEGLGTVLALYLDPLVRHGRADVLREIQQGLAVG